MKKLKLLVLPLVFMMAIFSLSGCWTAAGSPDYSKVTANIKEEYYNEFDNKEFGLSDFGLSNIKEFSYRIYPKKEFEDVVLREEIKFFTLILKKTGKTHAKSAIKQLKKLEFVGHADFCYHGMNPGIKV